jgi:hypothetical protein
LTKIGILEFEFVGDPVLFEVHVFDVTQYEGEPVETEGNTVPTEIMEFRHISFQCTYK